MCIRDRSPAKHFDADWSTAGSNEVERSGGPVRDIDDDALRSRVAPRAAIDHAKVNSPAVRHIRNANDSPEGVRRVRGDHGFHVKADAAGGLLAVESRTVVPVSYTHLPSPRDS